MRLHSLFKHSVYTFIMLVLIVSQCGVFRYIEIFNTRPQTVLLFVLALSFFNGPKIGAIYGLVAGYLLDVLSGGGAYFTSVIYMLVCYVAAYAVEYVFDDGYFPFLALSAASMIVKHILDSFVLAASANGFTFSLAFVNVFLPEFLYTVIVSAAIYFPTMLICSKLNEE